MKPNTYINAAEFLETLKNKGLVIVSAAEFEAGNEFLRAQLMRRKDLSLKEISDSGLLGKKHKRTIQRWIDCGKIKTGEWHREDSGKVKVLTVAIKRLGYGI
jgi:hypothetical protein